MAENRTLKGIYGEAGAVYESGTDTVTGDFCAILCITATTFQTLTWAELSGDTFTGVEIPAGTTIYGQISSFALASGSSAVLAYKASK
tara:strand:+ start:214 stop:477 length:264 start_codon:yes stop_codon:yes gene_type:complete